VRCYLVVSMLSIARFGVQIDRDFCSICAP